MFGCSCGATYDMFYSARIFANNFLGDARPGNDNGENTMPHMLSLPNTYISHTIASQSLCYGPETLFTNITREIYNVPCELCHCFNNSLTLAGRACLTLSVLCNLPGL